MRTAERETAEMLSDSPAPNRRSYGKKLAIAPCVLLVGLLFTAGVSAKTIQLHTYSGVYPAGSWQGADAVGAGSFPSGTLEKIDVDRSTGVVYVSSSAGAGRFYKFDASGVSQPFSARGSDTVISQAFGSYGDLEVDNSGTASQGRIYTLPEYGPINAYDPSGAATSGTNFPLTSGLGDVCGAAVGVNGHFFRSEYLNRIVEYDSNGSPTGPTTPVPSGLCDFEVDSLGYFYAPYNYYGGETIKFDSTGTVLATVDPGTSTAVAIDTSNNDVFIDVGSQVNHYTADGVLRESFAVPNGPYPGISNSRGVAVNSTTHTVYVTSNGSPTRVDAFVSSGSIVIADVTTDPATGMTRTESTLHGSVSADNVTTTNCRFEWGTTTDYLGGTAPCAEGNVFTGTSTNQVTAQLAGLTPATTYHFRISVTNPEGTAQGVDRTFTTAAIVKDVTTEQANNITRTTATLNGSFDPDGLETKYYFEYGTSTSYGSYAPVPPPGESGGATAGKTDVSAAIGSLSAETTYHFRLAASNSMGVSTGADETFTTTKAVKDLTTDAASNVTLTSATLNGSFDADGLETKYYFQFGPTSSYGSFYPVPPPGEDGGSSSGIRSVAANVAGLTPGSVYHYRLVASNTTYGTTFGADVTFTSSAPPSVQHQSVKLVNTDGAVLTAEINPGGFETTYHFEYGPEPCSISSCEVTDSKTLPEGLAFAPVSASAVNLSAGTTYYLRVVATNVRGTTVAGDTAFETYAPDSGTDECENAAVRQQTGAALLLDCRGYELVSPAHAGGVDVESDLVKGQTPLPALPRAKDRVLYSMHAGVVPGVAGEPTNFGRDPYVAARHEESGWSTEYVGLPSNGMADSGSFGSPLLEVDSSLSKFAFGGATICDPCFPDSSINIPLRLANGSVVKGMAGSLDPSADPVGFVAKRFSTDGQHFIFGASKPFELAGKDGSVSIYDRNLVTNATQVVSTLGDGTTMDGDVGELDVSSNGSRVIVGEEISTDTVGNLYWHPFMHIGSSQASVDLAPGTTTGVLYGGMSADGSRVYFSTSDELISADTDSSADVYEAAVDSSGTLTLRLISTNGQAASNDDACDPAGDIPWNKVAGGADCGAVLVAGGGGVAQNGTLYFFSPELLDGGSNGVADQPNLYVVAPGEAPSFVATVDSSVDKPGKQPLTRPVTNFAAGLAGPVGMTVDQGSGGDLYVAQLNSGKVTRFAPNGAADNFSSLGTNSIEGFTWQLGSGAAQVAVDSSSNPAGGDIYVVNGGFGSTKIDVYSSTGNHMTALTGAGTPSAAFGYACGVAVDQSTGAVYVGEFFGRIWRYTPTTNPVTEADYSGSIETGEFGTCGLGVAGGKIYSRSTSGNVRVYETSAFALGAPQLASSSLLTTEASAISVDPTTGDVFVDETTKITQYSSGGSLIDTLASGSISGSTGIAVRSSNHYLFASSGGSIVKQIGYELPVYAPIDHQAVVHGVSENARFRYSDFQVSADGRYAVFDSALSLAGLDTNGHKEVYRYDRDTESLNCASCPSTSALPLANTTLPSFGLGLTDDGRVFYSTDEPLVLRDTNRRRDAYEWKDGVIQLISAGTGDQDSGILSVSSDGVDAYFFTRDTLSQLDENGSTVKLYDAREGGGFFVDPQRRPCAASDECHGAGTQAPSAPVINSLLGSGQTAPKRPTRCNKRFVKRHGRCVKRHRKKRQRQHHRQSRPSHRRGG